MISRSTQHRTVAVEATPQRLLTRVEIAWGVAGEGLSAAPAAIRRAILGDGASRGTVRVIAAIELTESEIATVKLWIERGDGSRAAVIEVASIERAVVTRDDSAGLLHVDGAEGAANVLVTLRTCRDGVSLLFARSSIFEVLGVPGGRVESPSLRAVG